MVFLLVYHNIREKELQFCNKEAENFIPLPDIPSSARFGCPAVDYIERHAFDEAAPPLAFGPTKLPLPSIKQRKRSLTGAPSNQQFNQPCSRILAKQSLQ